MARKTTSTTRRTRKETAAPAFVAARDWISRFSVLPTDEDLDVLALWALGTWTFSPSSPAMPYAFPYLYLTGPKGSGKSHLGIEVMGRICRQHEAVAATTGATLFRLIGTYDEESREVIPHYPTITIDEVDAIYAGGGSNDEQLRGVGNAGYKLGLTVPRSAGRTVIRFPVYCPKMWVGIDNGRLPDTLTSRSIRIDIRQATPPEEGPYDYEVKEEVTELQETMAAWAKENATIYREYSPTRPDAIEGRRWELMRPLIQLARAAGVEQRIIDALGSILNRRPERASGREAMFVSLSKYLDENPDARNFLSRDIVRHLERDGIQLPGRGGQKGFSAALFPGKSRSADEIGSHIRLSKDDPRVEVSPKTGKLQYVARGYTRHVLEDAIALFFADYDDDEDDQ